MWRSLIFTLFLVLGSAWGAPVELFDGRSLEGWTGEAKDLWRVEDGAIVFGGDGQPHARECWLATVREFQNFELTFKARTDGAVGTGMFFRSAVKPGQRIVGWQCDVGESFDGGLYKEGRGGGMVAYPSKDLARKTAPVGQWNEYRVRAEGRRIRTWVNGQPMADFRDRDPEWRRGGVLAIEQSAYGNGSARFKDVRVEELPATAESEALEPAGPQERMTDKLAPAARTPFPGGKFELVADDVAVFIGSENVVLEQRTGWLETQLAAQWSAAAPRFRHMGWEGDTVYRQNRMEAWGSWKENLDGAGATVVLAWFGQVEAFDGTKSPDDFATAYGRLLDELARRTPRLVVIGPPPFEKPADPRVPDNSPRNALVRQHSDIARQLAAARGLVFVDVFGPLSTPPAGSPPLTRDGLHFNAHGLQTVAGIVARQLGAAPDRAGEPLRQAIVEKNRLWFDTWRCMNWAFAYGDRTTQPFATGANGQPPFVEELKKFRPLLAHADATVHALARKKPAPPPLPPEPARADPPAPSPEEEMSRFKLREGFAVHLFADEKLDVIRPIQIRWDERGRLWVACAPSYPQLQPGEHGRDFIIVLEDTDGDGKADTTHRFAENLTMPMGFEFAPRDVGGGLYVCESTQLVHLPDANGDGTADGREVILSGFGTGDTHQNINSLRWGPDGSLWFTQGYHIWSYVETPYGLAELNRAGVWRFNPRTLRLTSFLNESTAGLNCWGTAWDDYGQIFHGSGADFTIWHTTPALVPTLHPLSLGSGFAGSKGKSMEPEFLGSSHLPDDLRGVLLKSTYFTSQVQLYRLKDSGSGFESADLGDLISSSSPEFRPVETRVGPDGAIYICDWLNPVIGHYQASYRDPRRDRSHGRIWRMTAKDRPLVPRPALAALSAEALIGRLGSPEGWERDAAKYALYRRPAADVLPAADKAAAGADFRTADGARLLYELSGVFAAHEAPRHAIVENLLASEDFHWRAWGAHLTGVWADKLPDPLALAERAIADEHPRVRLEGVVACAWMPPDLCARAGETATMAMEKPVDSGINYALTQTIHALAPEWRRALAAGTLRLANRPHAMAKLLTTVGDPTAVKRIRDLLSNGEVSGPARESLLAVLVETGSPDDVAYAIAQAPGSQVVMDALIAAAFNKKDTGYGAVLAQLLNSPHSLARIAGCRVAATWGNDFGTFGRIRQLAGEPTAAPEERAAAIAAVGRLRGAAALPDLLALAEAPDPLVRSAALHAVAPLDPAAAATRCVALLGKIEHAADAGPLLTPLLNRKDGAATLAKALADTPPPQAAAGLALQWMGSVGRDDAPVIQALNTAAGVAAGSLPYSEATVAKWVDSAGKTGDATRGAALFRSPQATCLACHKLGAEGGTLGPDLTAIAKAMTPQMIVESVLWPKRQVKEGFLLTSVTTRSGEVYQGYREKENPDTITLRDVANGSLRLIGKADIASRNDAGTLMPEGLTAWMTDRQRADLLAFLFQLGK